MIEIAARNLRLIASLFRGSASSATVAIEGFDRFSARIEERLGETEKRLDKCDEDRGELRSEIGDLRGRVKSCEEDRDDLRRQINRHSREFGRLRAAGVEELPDPPHRTTKKRLDGSEGE